MERGLVTKAAAHAERDSRGDDTFRQSRETPYELEALFSDGADLGERREIGDGERSESRLPRDPSLGYYCYRVVHYTDYVEAVDVKAEVYDFDDQLKEAFHYRELQRNPGFTDADFDPKNRAYKLK